MCSPQEEAIIQREVIMLAAAPLSPRHRFVIAARYTGWTLEEVAEALSLSRERVRQIQLQSLRIMRHRAKKHGVKKLSDIGA